MAEYVDLGPFSSAVGNLVDGVSVGESIALPRPSAWLVPLLGVQTRRPTDLSLAAAVRQGVARVVESKGDAWRTYVELDNDSDARVLVAEGDVLVGGTEDRVVCVSTYAAPRSRVIVPVRSIEWDSPRPSKGEFVYKCAATVALRCLCAMRCPESSEFEQLVAWARMAEDVHCAGPLPKRMTGAVAYDYVVDEARAYVASRPLPDRCRGVAFCAQGTVVAMDLFGSSQMLRESFEGLLVGYLTELAVRSWPDERRGFDPARATAKLLHEGAMPASLVRGHASVGHAFHLAGEHYVGGGVLHDGQVHHLALLRR